MTTDPVARYVAATRLKFSSNSVPSAEARRYAEAFADVTSRLELEVKPAQPRLYVTDTANALVETLLIGGCDIVIYDTSLGRAFAQMSTFTLGDAPPHVVMQWGLKQMAIALASHGQFGPSFVVCMLAELEPARLTREPPRWSLEVPAEYVAVQEHFVLAHEWVHIALRQGLLVSEFVWSAEDLVRQTIDAAQGTLHAETTVDVPKALEADEAHAIERGSRFYAIGPEARAAIARSHQLAARNRAFIGQWTEGRAWLIEEIVCDFLATDLTVMYFAEIGVSPGDVLDAILHGLTNHGSLEQIRDHAQHISDGTRSSRSELISARLVAWRTAAPDVWGHYLGDVTPEEVRERMMNVSERHRQVIGDQVTYTLFADATAALAEFPDPLHVPKEDLIKCLSHWPAAPSRSEA